MGYDFSTRLISPRQAQTLPVLRHLAASDQIRAITEEADTRLDQWLISNGRTACACTEALQAAQIPYDLHVRPRARGADGCGHFNEYFRPQGSAGGTVRQVRTTEDGEIFLALSDWDAVAARPGGPITREDVLAHLGVPARSLADWCRVHVSVS